MGGIKIGADVDPIEMVNLHATSCTCCGLARGQPSVLIHSLRRRCVRIAVAWRAAISLIRAYRLTGDAKYIAAMQDASAHILGANQIGMRFITGLGRHWPQAPLHEDSIAAGIPALKGITIYG
jgi:hypothetical protein